MKNLENNRYYKLYESRVATDGPLAAVSCVDSLLIAKKQARCEIADDEAKEFAEFLRDYFASSKENYRGMIDMWGREPFVLRYADITVPEPDGRKIAKPVLKDIAEEEVAPDDEFDDYGIRYDIALELAERIWKLHGRKIISYSSPEITYQFDFAIPDKTQDLVNQEMIDSFVHFLCCFLADDAGHLTVKTEPYNEVYGFVSRGTDWEPIPARQLADVMRGNTQENYKYKAFRK